jgi:hypothetical protein
MLVGEAEVHHPHAAPLVDHYIVGLEVAVDQTREVRGRDSAGRVGQHLHDLGPAAPALAGPRVEGLAGHELHRNPHTIVVGADVVHGDHVRVGQLRQRLGLAQQPHPALGGPISRPPRAGAA